MWSWESDPFGTTAANEDPDGDGNHFTLNLRFPGQYYDSETGLHYNYFRYYDPGTGRYVTSDPIGLWGGLNSYGYVAGNPIKYVDYFGLEKYDVNIAFDVIRNNTSMKVPRKFQFEGMGPGYKGSVDPFTNEMSINSGMYDGALNVLEAYDLLNTVVHETLHYNNESFIKRMYEAYIDTEHQNVRDVADMLTEELWEKFYWEWENNKYWPGNVYCEQINE